MSSLWCVMESMFVSSLIDDVVMLPFVPPFRCFSLTVHLWRFPSQISRVTTGTWAFDVRSLPVELTEWQCLAELFPLLSEEADSVTWSHLPSGRFWLSLSFLG